jgi:hypothetical protein
MSRAARPARHPGSAKHQRRGQKQQQPHADDVVKVVRKMLLAVAG